MTSKFQDLEAPAPKDVHAALLRNDAEELRLMAITIALSGLDFNLTQTVCIRLASFPDSQVRGNALVSLGHLARRFGQLDEQAVRPLIESALHDGDAYVRERAKSAADEIHQFLYWNIRGHDYG
jgi:HEAT repeat protein